MSNTRQPRIFCRTGNIFSKYSLNLGKFSLVKHQMNLANPIPFKVRYRRIPPYMFEEVKNHLKMDLETIKNA